MPEEAVTSELSDQVDAGILRGCEAPERAATVPALGRVRGPRKDVPGPDESVTMVADRVEVIRGDTAARANHAGLSGRRHRGHPLRRSGSRASDSLPVLMFVYLLVAGAVTVWILDPASPSGGPDEPDISAEYLELTEPVKSAAVPTVPAVAQDTLSSPVRPYSSLTGSGAPWRGVEQTLRTLDSLFADSTSTAERRR
jgi:hypothetical protein